MGSTPFEPAIMVANAIRSLLLCATLINKISRAIDKYIAVGSWR